MKMMFRFLPRLLTLKTFFIVINEYLTWEKMISLVTG